jgi:GNAT superfamily N-acetyltransferase
MDQDAIVALSLRAWDPVFVSIEAVLGAEINRRLHGNNWRPFQERAVRQALSADGVRVWVAEDGGSVVGFVAASVSDHDRAIGEISMLAVDPVNQRRGIGTALTNVATDWLRETGMRVATIETGGDAGHAPARRVYRKADYTPIPIVRYFKPL